MTPTSSPSRVAWLIPLIALSAMGCRSLANSTPTRVETGLIYTSGQPEFDDFFAEFHRAQQALARAPDDERALRRTLSNRLSIEEGSTSQLLVDTLAQRAKELADKKTTLELVVEGLAANDETDTMVQSRVTGPLDGAGKTFVEEATLLARGEVRLAAGLRKLRDHLDRLTMQARALEPSLDGSFSSEDYARASETRRNLAAATRALPMMSLKAHQLAESSAEFVKRLKVALTTAPVAQGNAEPPLITTEPSTAASKVGRSGKPGRASSGVTAPSKTKQSSAPAGSSGGDFEP